MRQGWNPYHILSHFIISIVTAAWIDIIDNTIFDRFFHDSKIKILTWHLNFKLNKASMWAWKHHEINAMRLFSPGSEILEVPHDHFGRLHEWNLSLLKTAIPARKPHHSPTQSLSFCMQISWVHIVWLCPNICSESKDMNISMKPP